MTALDKIARDAAHGAVAVQGAAQFILDRGYGDLENFNTLQVVNLLAEYRSLPPSVGTGASVDGIDVGDTELEAFGSTFWGDWSIVKKAWGPGSPFDIFKQLRSALAAAWKVRGPIQSVTVSNQPVWDDETFHGPRVALDCGCVAVSNRTGPPDRDVRAWIEKLLRGLPCVHAVINHPPLNLRFAIVAKGCECEYRATFTTDAEDQT